LVFISRAESIAVRSVCFLVAVTLLQSSLARMTGNLRLSAYPPVAVADSRSTVTITADVRDSAGHPAPDGTQVLFSASLGNFREAVVSTYSGTARGTLIAGGAPGTSHITVSAPGLGTESALEFELLGDRSLLSSAQEFIEMYSPSNLVMSADGHAIEATNRAQGAHLRYRDLDLNADDIQMDLNVNEIRATHAAIRFGKVNRIFEQLYFDLFKRKGIGTTSTKTTEYRLYTVGWGFGLHKVERQTVDTVQITSAGVEPTADVGDYGFKSMQSAAMIYARKAVVFPHKDIQFQKATIVVDGSKVVRFPLYDLNMNGSTGSIADQIVNINDTRVSINYPHYLTLKPGLTSLVRFRTGEGGGVGSSVNTATYLDYEMHWNRGDEADGSFTFTGLARKDYGLELQQNLRLNNTTSAYAQLSSPALRSGYGAFGLNHQMGSYQLNLTGSANRSLQGINLASNQVSLTLEKNPMRLTSMPIQTFVGASVSNNQSLSGDIESSQTAMGLHVRNQLIPRKLAKNATLNAAFTVADLVGHNTRGGLTLSGNTYLSSAFGRGLSMQLGYDYYNDPFSSAIVGQHRMSLSGNYFASRTGLRLSANKSLDADRLDYSAYMNYRISGLWRLSSSYAFDRFNAIGFLDYNATLAYRLGGRDIGVSWSKSTGRLGIQVLGASYN
jgi:hypothetical protein